MFECISCLQASVCRWLRLARRPPVKCLSLFRARSACRMFEDLTCRRTSLLRLAQRSTASITALTSISKMRLSRSRRKWKRSRSRRLCSAIWCSHRDLWLCRASCSRCSDRRSTWVAPCARRSTLRSVEIRRGVHISRAGRRAVTNCAGTRPGPSTLRSPSTLKTKKVALSA